MENPNANQYSSNILNTRTNKTGKTIKFSLFLLAITFLTSLNSFSQIWVTRISYGQPIGTFYLGDKINTGSNWYFNFEIGLATWDSSQVGIGQNSDGTTGWDYADAFWYDDNGLNKRVRRNVAEFQFTATGNWYVTGRAKASSEDAYTYADETGWTNDQSFSTTNASYWTVSSLSAPSLQSATLVTNTAIDLSWTKWNSKNVMIVRNTTGVFTAPTQGTAYSVGNSIGTGTVVYNGSGTTYNNAGLDPGLTYYYAFYSENYSYYSVEVTASASTPKNFRSKTTGNWNQNSTWEMSNGLTWIDASSTPTSADPNINIRNTHVVTLSADASATNLTIETGGSLSLSTFTMNIANNGSFINNSSLNSGTGSVVFLGAGYVDGSSVSTFYNVTINAASSFGDGKSKISGTLTLNNGSYVDYNAPIYNTGSTLKYNSGGIYERRVEWDNVGTVGTTPGHPYHVLITNSTTLDYPNTGDLPFSKSLEIGGNLTIDSNSSLFLAYGDKLNKSGQLTVSGNVTVNGNLGLGDALLGDIVVKGNWTRGSGSSFAPNNRAVFFTGTSSQTINVDGGELFDYVILDNSNQLILTTNATVKQKLEMISGDITTGTNTLTIGTSTTDKGQIAWTNGLIYGKIARWFNGTNSGNISGLLPLGYDTNDRFITVEYSSAPTIGGTLTAQWISTQMGSAGLPISISTTGTCGAFDIVNTADDGYWQIDAGNALSNDGNYDITLVGENVYGITDICKLAAIKRVGLGDWASSGTHIEPSGTSVRPVLKRSGATGWSNWGFGGAIENPLPVEITSFTANCSESNVFIFWSTVSEINNDYFTLEKSTNGTNWSQIVKISGAGNSNTSNDYNYIDSDISILKTNYYRLKQTDFDGIFSYSNTISTNCENYNLPSFNIYPNPNNGEFNVVANFNIADSFSISILDASGKIVLQKNNIRNNQEKIEFTNPEPGFYILTIQYLDSFKTVKLIIE